MSVENTKVHIECTNSILFQSKCVCDARVSAKTRGVRRTEGLGTLFRIIYTPILKTKMFDREHTRAGVYVLLLLTLMFVTLVTLLRIFSGPDYLRTLPPTRKTWINHNDRKTLEKLDPKLVETLDQLFKQPDYNRLKTRIERRLYVFPFLTHSIPDRSHVTGVVERVMVENFGEQVFDSMVNQWAINRTYESPYEI